MLLVAHLHFLPLHKPTLKNAKELPSQRTSTDKMNEQTATEKEQRRHNIGFAKWRVQCFYDSLVQGSTFGILMNICAKNPPLRKAAKRQVVKKPHFQYNFT